VDHDEELTTSPARTTRPVFAAPVTSSADRLTAPPLVLCGYPMHAMVVVDWWANGHPPRLDSGHWIPDAAGWWGGACCGSFGLVHGQSPS
jgi:hypothetical protein